MFEETNQTELELENIFEDDMESSEDINEPEEVEEPQREEPEESAQPSDSEVITAKFLDREIPLDKAAVEKLSSAAGLSPDDLITVFQKGLNYDRVKETAESLKNAKEIQILDAYAKSAGMSREEYLLYLERQKEELDRQTKVTQLKQQYPDGSPELLDELAARRSMDEKLKRQMELTRRQSLQGEMIRRQWVDFFKEHPEITDASALPKEVMERVMAGETPSAAYTRYEKDRLERELAALRQHEENKEKAMGGAKGDGAEEEKDAFLAGFLA